MADLLTEPASAPPSQCAKSFAQLHTGNVLCVATHPDDASLVISCGSDRTVQIFRTGSDAPERTLTPHDSAVLDAAFLPSAKLVVATTGMDGACVISDAGTGEALQQFHEHQKYANRVCFSSDGEVLATGSYDHTARVYKRKETGGAFSFAMRKQFVGNVESLCTIPDTHILVIGVRGDNYLHMWDVDANTVTKMNLNANGDDHVSFAALDIKVSNDGRFVVVATDTSRVLVYQIGNSQPLRLLCGVLNDGFSQPRCALHPNMEYIACTSQDNKVVVWETATESVAAELIGHTKLPRAICTTTNGDDNEFALLTGSFDHSVKLWTK